MNILVTGASGYVAQQMIPRLSREGHTVTALSRSKQAYDNVNSQVISEYDKKTFVKFVNGQDVVIHLASMTQSNSPAAFKKANEDVVTALVESLSDSSTQLIYFSSDMAGSPDSFYGQSKRNCEAIIEKHLPNYVIIRPSLIYGLYKPNANSTVSKMLQTVRNKRLMLTPTFPEVVVSPLFYDDLHEAMMKALGKESRSILHIHGKPIPLAEMIKSLENLERKRMLKVPVPVFLLKSVAKAVRPYKMFASFPADRILSMGFQDKQHSAVEGATSLEQGLKFLSKTTQDC